jgi:hypothetical protein
MCVFGVPVLAPVLLLVLVLALVLVAVLLLLPLPPPRRCRRRRRRCCCCWCGGGGGGAGGEFLDSHRCWRNCVTLPVVVSVCDSVCLRVWCVDNGRGRKRPCKHVYWSWIVALTS